MLDKFLDSSVLGQFPPGEKIDFFSRIWLSLESVHVHGSKVSPGTLFSI